MKRFSCGDVVPGCNARFEGAAESDILAQVARHAQQDHGLTSLSDELVQTVRSRIVDTDTVN